MEDIGFYVEPTVETEYLLTNVSLVSASFTAYGEPKGSTCYQNEDEIYLWSDERYPIFLTETQLDNSKQLVKKTREYKEILGYKCYKHIYQKGANTIIIAWIPKELPCKNQHSKGGFFTNIIMPHGLALEKIVEYKGKLSHLTATKIEFVIPTEEEIQALKNIWDY